jgi:hypothetical protein
LYIPGWTRLQWLLLLFGWQGRNWIDELEQANETYCTPGEHLGHVFSFEVGVLMKSIETKLLSISKIELFGASLSREVEVGRCCSALCRHWDVQPADPRPLQAGTTAVAKHERRVRRTTTDFNARLFLYIIALKRL